jgi:hypothetical protein
MSRLTDEQDPLTDAPTGPCQRCQHGYVTIALDSDGHFLGNDPNDPAYAEIVANTAVYPCPDCRPQLFLQWENGCFQLYHEPCEKCDHRRRPSRRRAHHDDG